MNPWFRFYTSTAHDPKVQRLPDRLFKAWVNLLCLAAENDGSLPGASDCAYVLRLSDEDMNSILEQLSERGLFDESESGLKPHNWDGRQYKSDVSTDRVKRFREKKRNVSETAIETAPEQKQNRTESEQTRARGNVSETVSAKVRGRITEAFAKGNSPNVPDTSRVDIWLAQGFDPEIIVAVIAEGVKRKPSISSLNYFDNAIREATERKNPTPAKIKSQAEKEAEWEAIIRRLDGERARPYRTPSSIPADFVARIQAKIDAEKPDDLDIPQFLDRRGAA
jgi:hypothetical protein